MLKCSRWRFNFANSRWLQPFFVRDRFGRSLGSKGKRIVVVLVLLAALSLLAQSALVSKLYNLRSLEEIENEFVLNFYQTYNQLYYWMYYRGNLAAQLADSLATDSSGKAYWQQILPHLQMAGNLVSINYGQVGSANSWSYQLVNNIWQPAETKENQNFSAWFLRQAELADGLYWREEAENRQLKLFWIFSDEQNRQYYFQANVNFNYQGVSDKLRQQHSGGMAFFAAGSEKYQLFPLADEQHLAAGSQTADTSSSAVSVPFSSSLELERWLFIPQEIDKILQNSQANHHLNYYRFNGVGYWIKSTPILTNTTFSRLYLVVQERAFWGVLQLRTWMVISFLAIISLMSICLFAYYYWQHSRRYYFTNQIKEIIKQGEGAHLEFKSTLRYDLKEKKINKLLEKVVLKSIAAFNNSDGGLLLIGVDDAGKILGLKADYRTLKKPDKDGFELHLRSLISRSYGEHFVLQQIEIYFPCLAKEEVCVLKINKGRKPLYISVADKNGAGKSEKFYIRRGNSSIAMEKPSDIMAYQKDRFSWRGKLPFGK
mgnify:CR=1 FL=1